jgi:hypothetical protein
MPATGRFRLKKAYQTPKCCSRISGLAMSSADEPLKTTSPLTETKRRLSMRHLFSKLLGIEVLLRIISHSITDRINLIQIPI